MATLLRDVVFFLAEDGSSLLMLDVTSSMEVVRAASVATNTLQSGVKVSDHYHPDLPNINITGTINTTKLRNITLRPQDYVELINQSMDNAVVFTLFGTEDGLVPSFDNCVVTSFSYLKEGRDSLDVSLNIQQIDFGMKAELDSLTTVKIKPASEVGSSLAEKSDSKTGTKTAVDGSKYIDGIPVTQKAIERGVT